MSDRAEAEEDRSNPDKRRCVASFVRAGTVGAGEAEDEVEEKEGGHCKHVDVDSVHHIIRVVAIVLQMLLI